ncbi:MAG: hypothetical protein H6726_09865 [Sandaracinaceae bacterium]|nr:hypothetical protein [Myxococcales bacterium]MCB9657941.1 hypothetical protein [Sandaracinaceae bacterium]
MCFPARGCCTIGREGRACEGRGECGAGEIECDENGGARCSTEPGGSADESVAELCNGLDDDCDGEIDEDFLVGDPCDGTGACGAGTIQCNSMDATMMTAVCSTEPGGSQNQALPNDALCNGIDDDCDGQTDEDRGVGMVCDGAGLCGEGFLECASLNTTRCSTDPGGSANMGGNQDPCDQQDNDCDGNTDEGFNTGVACPGIGACGAGLVECATTTSTRCSTHPGGSQFTGAANDMSCNGVDDDCDTRVDEDLGVGQPCDPPGVCGPGVFECASMSGTRCSTGPGGSNSGVQTEVCNGVNDDCDGATDEGFNVGGACTAPGQCGPGVFECNGSGGTRCSSGPGGSNSQVQPEVCNGLDDDCANGIDNGAASVLCPTSVSNTSSTVCNGVAGCAIMNCNPNFFDADGVYSNGCECNDTEAGSDASCTASTFDADLALNQVAMLTGVISTGSDDDWYRVRATGGVTSGVDITFGSNPGSALRFEVDQDGCTVNPSCGSGTNLTQLTRNNCGANLTGTVSCNNTGSHEYYIRVHRASGSSATCVPYTIVVRAASTNP